MSTPWTAQDIPDLTGRTALVTGANSGLGLATATELARHGAHVVMASRDEARGAAAVERVRAEGGKAELELPDLASLAAIRAAADRLAATLDGLDLLVNNAGVMATPRRATADGFELQLGTNHLGHFALTGLLMPLLLARPGARVVTVSSLMHRVGRMTAQDPLGERATYRKWDAYGRSKLANLLFALELDRRARAAGRDLLSVAAHPGWASTNLQTAGPRMAGSRLGVALSALGNRLLAQSAEDGALPSLYAATAPTVSGGDYIGPGGLAETRGAPRRVAMSAAARDERVAAALWTASEAATGVLIHL